MEAGKNGAPADVAEAAEDDDNVMASWLTVDEETATELSKLLESFGSVPPPVKVRFTEEPYASTTVFQSSAAYVTINCNEESCGSSFSDSDSSVMASIDLGGARRFVGGGEWDTGTVETRAWWKEGSGGDTADVDFDLDLDLDGFLTDGCDYGGVDDEDAMWAEFLGEGIFGTL